MLSLSQYCALFAGIMSTRSCGPPYWIGVACFAGHESVDYRKDIVPKDLLLAICFVKYLAFDSISLSICKN